MASDGLIQRTVADVRAGASAILLMLLVLPFALGLMATQQGSWPALRHAQVTQAPYWPAKSFQATSHDPLFIQPLTKHIQATYKISTTLAEAIVRSAWQVGGSYRLPISLLLAIVAVESSFRPTAYSKAGAIGLMQVRPGAHPELASTDMRAVPDNIKAGTQVLATYLSQSKGNMLRALQQYNGARRDRHAKYAHKVLARMLEFQLVADGAAAQAGASLLQVD